MRGIGSVGRWRVLPAMLLVIGALALGGASDAARAQEPRGQLEVTGLDPVEGGMVVTVLTSAGLAGKPTLSVDGAPRTVEAAPGLRPAVVLAIETSSSMTPEQLAATRQAATAFLGQLPSSARVAVVTFDGSVRTAGFSDDASAARSALEGLTPNGGSALFDGISTAAARLKEAERASASLVIVTHGWDWGGASASTRADAYAAVQTLGAEVFPVILGTDFDGSLLTSLAKPSRATGWTIDDLASGRLATAVAAGARLEQRVRFTYDGLPAGDHEVSVGWDGPVPATAVVRSFPVAAQAAETAAGGAQAAAESLANGGGLPWWPILALVALVVGSGIWFVRGRAGSKASKVTGRLDVMEDASSTRGGHGHGTDRIAPLELALAAPVEGPRRDPGEQRAFDRVQLGVPAELSLSGVDAAGPQPVVAFDISEGGLSFRTRRPIAAGSHGYLSMELPPDGDEVQLHVLILNVVPVDTETYSAHCSFIDITPRTLWRIVGACLALSGDTANAAQLMDWGGKHAATADQRKDDPLFEPAIAEASMGVAAAGTAASPIEADPAFEVASSGAATMPRFPWEDDTEQAAGDASTAVAAEAVLDDDIAPIPQFTWEADEADDVLDGDGADAVAAVPADVDAYADAEVQPAPFIVNADAFELVAPAGTTGGDDLDPGEAFESSFAMHLVTESVAEVVADDAAGGAVDAGMEVAAADAEKDVEVSVVDTTADAVAEEFEASEVSAEPIAVRAAAVRDDRVLGAAMRLAELLGDAAGAEARAEVADALRVADDLAADGVHDVDGAAGDVSVAAVDEVDEAHEGSAGTDESVSAPALVAVRSGEMQETRYEATTTHDDLHCSHCAGGVLELQRLVRQDEYLESWWLCLACSRITYRQQEPEAWLRTTSVPDGLEDPRVTAPSTDFGAMVLRMRQEEAAATARAAQLRDELARTEGVLHDIRMLHRLLDRFGMSGASVSRAENESPAA